MMKSSNFDVLVAGELNVDLIMDDITGNPEVGKEQIAGRMTLTLGSSSAIFAANLSSLGSGVAFGGLVGDDQFGRFVHASLEEKRVDTRYVKTSGDHRTGATVAFNFGQDRMMVTHPGAMSAMTMENLPLEELHQFRHLHLSSVFLQPGLKPALATLFEKAKRAGLTTSLDPQWDPQEEWRLDLDRLLPHLDFFLPNQQELLCMTGADSLEQALAKLPSGGGYIVIKQGNRGAMMITPEGEQFREPACKLPDFIDAIGAGDSFDAGLIHTFLKGWPKRKCLRFANLAGAVSTTGAGGTSAIRSFEQILETGKTMEFSLDETT